jgi:hypothetical protein
MTSSLLKDRLRQIPADKEIEILEDFLFELTIAFRSIFPIEELESETLIQGLRMINEINHRVLNRIRDLRAGRDTFPDYISEMVTHHVCQAPAIAGWVGTALERALARYDA